MCACFLVWLHYSLAGHHVAPKKLSAVSVLCIVKNSSNFVIILFLFIWNFYSLQVTSQTTVCSYFYSSFRVSAVSSSNYFSSIWKVSCSSVGIISCLGNLLFMIDELTKLDEVRWACSRIFISLQTWSVTSAIERVTFTLEHHFKSKETSFFNQTSLRDWIFTAAANGSTSEPLQSTQLKTEGRKPLLTLTFISVFVE